MSTQANVCMAMIVEFRIHQSDLQTHYNVSISTHFLREGIGP